MLVVPELAHEMECLEQAVEKGIPSRLARQRHRRDDLADAVQLATWQQSAAAGAGAGAGAGYGGAGYGIKTRVESAYGFSA
jgi:hypothetical protein